MTPIGQKTRSVVSKALRDIGILPPVTKHSEELRYWRSKFVTESNSLNNSHYRLLYTSVFGMTDDDYRDKNVLDIGCGPRGSLEWAHMARRRVGLDPLADEYQKLGADKHAMEYSNSPSEIIPFDDGTFDIVTCLNALDHVDDFDKTVAEIKRVTRPGGMFLLSVETDHEATATEPISVTDARLALFNDGFTVVSEFRVGTPADHDLHQAVVSRHPAHIPGQPGIYVAKMVRGRN
jgi:2-polyprenyl-3-methyl-5-hydroxy-6-metoxy-1,4-benzoquinol methylase